MNAVEAVHFQNATEQTVPDAPTSLRLCAAAIDLFLCASFFLCIFFVFSRFLPVGLNQEFVAWFYGESFDDSFPARFETSYTSLLVRGATLVGLALTLIASYHIRGDRRSATLGKLVFGLTVRSRDLSEVTQARAIVRCIGKFLVLGLCSVFIGGPLFFFAFVVPEEFLVHYFLTLTVLIFALCLVRFTRKGGTFHDTFSWTRVIRRRDLVNS